MCIVSSKNEMFSSLTHVKLCFIYSFNIKSSNVKLTKKQRHRLESWREKRVPGKPKIPEGWWARNVFNRERKGIIIIGLTRKGSKKGKKNYFQIVTNGLGPSVLFDNKNEQRSKSHTSFDKIITMTINWKSDWMMKLKIDER